MKRLKLILTILSIVIGTTSAFAISPIGKKSIEKLITIVIVQTGPLQGKVIDPAVYNPALCPVTNPLIICAQSFQDGVPLQTVNGGYYLGL